VLLFNKYAFDLDEIFNLIKHKEIRKPITKESIWKNWSIAKKEMESGASQIFYAIDVNSFMVEEFIEKLNSDIS